MNISPQHRKLGIVLALLGMAVAVILNTALTIPAYEAFSYFRNTNLIEHKSLNGLSCPRLIGQGQPAEFTLKVRNRADKPLQASIRMHFAGQHSDFSDQQNFQIPAGGSQSFAWQAGEDQVIFGRMVLADFFLISSPNRYATCSVLILPWRINGTVILWLGVILSLALMAVGSYLWLNKVVIIDLNKPYVARSILALEGIAALGLVFTLLGAWAVSLVLILLFILMVVILGAIVLEEI
jgi:hypothetical protein